jgi:hypothetical protein
MEKKNKFELLNVIADKLNLLSYAPRTVNPELIKKWSDEGLAALAKLRIMLDKEKVEND